MNPGSTLLSQFSTSARRFGYGVLATTGEHGTESRRRSPQHALVGKRRFTGSIPSPFFSSWFDTQAILPLPLDTNGNLQRASACHWRALG
jgi:hypothetical protein